MNIRIAPDRRRLGQWAAAQAAATLRRVLAERGSARLVACTGSSQFEVLEALTAESGVDWPRIEMFHLDEYVGLPESHPASFRRFLRERLVAKTGITNYHFLNGEGDPQEECRRA